METKMMKKLLIAATLASAALAATPLLADPHQGHGQRGARQTGAAENCQMQGSQGTRAEHRAEMQKRMQEMHASMGSHENRGHGQGRGKQDEHKH
jgi:hypothetical protein